MPLETPVPELMNVGTEFLFRGKTYLVRKPNQLEQARFSRWLEQRAREAAGRAVDLPAEIQDRLLRTLNSEIAAGEYEWGGAAYVSACLKPFGIAKLISLQLAAEHPECTHEFCLEMVMARYEELAAGVLGRPTSDPKVREALERSFAGPSAS
jgi:hypothetical protein